jgi:DNA invertase Pin-like site-specific DNA recombinase
MNELPCVIYAAKSTEDIRGSIGTQLKDCRAAIEREGARRVVVEHKDESASAFRGNRGPGLGAAKRDAGRLASEHGAAEVWVQHSDRLARGDGVTADHLAEVFFELRRAGVQLRSVHDDGTFTNPMLVAAIGERNREDSTRKSLACRAGKRRRWEAGKVVGGPVHDGYKLAPELDEHGKPMTERDGRVVYRRVIDADRAPMIERIFAMIEAGHTPGAVARALNGDGVRTVRGKQWTAKRIRETVQNPYYAGWITAYGERTQGDHEALIEPERWERITAALRRLDPAAVQRRRPGRPAIEDYLLRRIAFCGECGQPLNTRRYASGRHYICAAVRQARGTCGAAAIPADVAEAQVLARLETFVGDVEQWIAARAAEASSDRELFERGIREQRVELGRLERRAERARAQHQRLLDEGNEQLADAALGEVARIGRERDQLAQTLADAEQHLADWQDPNVDAALDYYKELRDAIGGRIANAKSVRDLNAALATVLEGIWLHTVEDPDLGPVLLAQFILRGTDEAGRPPDIALATRVGHWRELLDEQQPIVPAQQDPGTAVTGGETRVLSGPTPSYRSTR